MDLRHSKITRAILLYSVLFLSGRNLLGHSNHTKLARKTFSGEAHMQEINNQYIKLIQPIFQGKCFDCHSQFTQYPWYYRLPGVRRLIDHDIAEARKHLDMSNGFPFQGHGSIESDLEAIETTIKERKMPPIRFKVLHWNSSLTEEEIRQVARWISEARRKLDIGRSAELSIQEK